MTRIADLEAAEIPEKLRRKVMSEGEQRAIIDLKNQMLASSTLCVLAKALLMKINNMTTEEFSRGGEQSERRALHAELVRLGVMEFDAEGNPELRGEAR